MKQHFQWVFWIGLSIALVFGAGLSILLYQATLRQPEPRIQAVLAEALDDQFNPVRAVSDYSVDDTFYISVRTQYVPAHSIVTIKWYYDGRLITSQDQVIGAVSDVYVLGFELQRTDGLWPAGQYRADVLLGGAIVGAAHFAVVTQGA